MHRASDAAAIRALEERLRTVQMGGAPGFLLSFENQGVVIREVSDIRHESGPPRRAILTTRIIASGSDLTEAVKNARAIFWTAENLHQ
jgi:hypothetical protein